MGRLLDGDGNLVQLGQRAGSASIPVVSAYPDAPTWQQLFAPTYYANDHAAATPVTIDLTRKRGMWLYAMMGRQAATALTRFSYLAVRPTLNGSGAYRINSPDLDRISTVVAVGSTTLNGATIVGDTTAVLTSATTFAVGDNVCFSSPDTNGLRVEFARIRQIASTTLTFERPLLIAHSNADRITSAADAFGRSWIPGGDIYEIYPVNSSGQAVIWHAEGSIVP